MICERLPTAATAAANANSSRSASPSPAPAPPGHNSPHPEPYPDATRYQRWHTEGTLIRICHTSPPETGRHWQQRLTTYIRTTTRYKHGAL